MNVLSTLRFLKVLTIYQGKMTTFDPFSPNRCRINVFLYAIWRRINIFQCTHLDFELKQKPRSLIRIHIHWISLLLSNRWGPLWRMYWEKKNRFNQTKTISPSQVNNEWYNEIINKCMNEWIINIITKDIHGSISHDSQWKMNEWINLIN